MSELDLLKRLKPHPNVIRLLGCITKDVIRRRGKREFSKFACFVKSMKSMKMWKGISFVRHFSKFFEPLKVVGSILDHDR